MLEVKVESNARLIAAALDKVGPRAQVEVDQVTRRYGHIGLALVRKKASGRPGPRRRTGDYVRSWNVRTSMSGGAFGSGLTAGVTAEIGTNAPQALRLENGFFGQDSLGRRYRQRAYPHAKPAARELERPYRQDIGKAMQKLVN